jgi:vancomycin resistance protein YoaR
VSGPYISSARRRGGRGRTALVVVLVVLVAGALAASAIGGGWLLVRDRIPARTAVGAVEIGGLTEAQARVVLTRAAAVGVRRPVRLVGPGGVERVTGAELGARPDVDAVLEQARAAGLAERLWRRLGFGGERTLSLEYALGPVRVARLGDRLDERFADRPVNADVAVEGTAVSVVPAAPGTLVDRRALRRALVTLPAEVGVVLVDADPSVSNLEAARAGRQVERLLDVPRVVRYRGVDATVWPRRLGELVRTASSDGRLAVSLDPRGLTETLRLRLGRFEQPARDATFRPVGARVVVVPSRAGRALDGERIGASLVGNPRARAHLARFTDAPPALTTQAAKTLGIREQISEFTTYHPCCAPRVNNIHRGADILDGTIVLPGRRFDLNQAMGQRTEARGFVAAPQIFNGRLEDAVGGGVSQIATTMYNAAFFAGVQIITHQPHEFYISRYPMGREATVSWGGPELIWRNDWPAAIFVDTSYTDTSITIRFYSSKLGRKVVTQTGEPCCTVAPTTIVVSNPSAPPGSRTTVQEAGPSGFTVSYTRKVFRDGTLRRNERYTWRYKAENAIVEVGPAAPAKPDPKPDAKPKPKPQPDDGDTSTTPTTTE